MNIKTKNKFIFLIYALLLGLIIGSIVWGFMKLASLGTELLWIKLPNIMHIPLYTIIICTLGGIIIGIWKKYTGDYPEDMKKVIETNKTDGRYPYEKTGIMFISSLLPLIFGASVGPESGLIGIIFGLCSWINDKFKHLFKEMTELTKIGVSATLGTIFNNPMFGFTLPLESDDDNFAIPKASKVILYFVVIFGALTSAMLLKNIFGGSSGLANFGDIVLNTKEWLLLIPLCFVGIFYGIIYTIFDKITNLFNKFLGKHTVIKCTIGGIILGISGTTLPLVMFSGEEQMGEIIDNYEQLGILILLLTGFIKLFITNICNNLGLKGGHFFPCIFSGICIGYANAIFFNINPVFSVCIVTTALMAYLIKKPVAVVLLLMICFPVQAIPVMLPAAIIGSFINQPNLLKKS